MEGDDTKKWEEVVEDQQDRTSLSDWFKLQMKFGIVEILSLKV